MLLKYGICFSLVKFLVLLLSKQRESETTVSFSFKVPSTVQCFYQEILPCTLTGFKPKQKRGNILFFVSLYRFSFRFCLSIIFGVFSLLYVLNFNVSVSFHLLAKHLSPRCVLLSVTYFLSINFISLVLSALFFIFLYSLYFCLFLCFYFVLDLIQSWWSSKSFSIVPQKLYGGALIPLLHCRPLWLY